jgi:predicted permease
MKWMHSVRARLGLLRRGAAEARMEEELRFHLEMETEKYVREGQSPEEARRRAVLAFGGVEGHKEEMRDGRGTRSLEELIADVRFALRHFRRTWGTVAAMVLVLALGLGASTAVYAALHGYLTLPAPGITRDEALVRIRVYGTHPQWPGLVPLPMPYSDISEYVRHRELFDGVAAWASRAVVIDPGDGERGVLAADARYVTASYFPLLGVKPVVGPGLPLSFGAGDAATPVAVISHLLWRQRFGSSPDVVGRRILVDGVPVTVVGVAPRRFSGVNTRSEGPGLWLPLPAQRTLERGRHSVVDEPDSASVYAFARLRSGVAPRDAQALVRLVAERGTRAGSDGQPLARSADVVPLLGYNDGPPTHREEDALVLASLGALALLILLVTCTNASGLLLAMALRRRREIAVRLSLGAGRGRIVRQLLTESVLLALAAAALGALTLWALLSAFGDRFPELRAEMDGRVIAFTFGLAVATGVLFGLSPALHATRLAVGEVLKDSAASVSAPRAWLQRALVVAQVALTQPLLVGLAATTLLLASAFSDRAGREIDAQVATLTFGLWAGNAPVEVRRATMDRMVGRLAAVPGVSGAILKSNMMWNMNLRVPDEDRVAGIRYPESNSLSGELIAPGYLGLMDIRLLRGRDFREEERAGPERQGDSPIIVGESLARELWGAADPIGRRLVEPAGEKDPENFVVVGMVADEDLRAAAGNARVFFPQNAQGFSGTVLVRTVGPAEPMLPLLRAVASAEAPQLPMERVTTLATTKADQREQILRVSALAAAAGMLALLLSAVGLYAVISFSVGQSTREIGIRTALGAQARQVIGTFFASGLRLSILGLVIGLPFGLLALRLLTRELGMPVTRMPVLAGTIAALVIIVASLATWIPARRAARVDPMSALRSD